MVDENELFEILVGTYEEYLLGYKLLLNNKVYTMKHTIANHSHKGSLRSVAGNGRYLASGGTDECIYLYDLLARKECGLLVHHSGTVTSLSFTPDGHYLISGSEDGAMAIVAKGSWVLDKVWTKAHKGKAVNCISVHPSGKMALSVGNDCTLRTWNLIKGRCAYIVNVASKCKRPEIVEWSQCGNYFGLVNERVVDVYCVQAGNVIRTLQVDSKITCLQFLMEEKVCIGESSGQIACFNFLSGTPVWSIPSTDDNRVKCLRIHDDWLVAANSLGKIHVYKQIGGQQKPKLAISLDSNCRITCMTLSPILRGDEYEVKKKKLKPAFEVKTEKKDQVINQTLKESVPEDVQCCPPDQKWQVELI